MIWQHFLLQPSPPPAVTNAAAVVKRPRSKKLSVEQMYQRKTQLEHVLLRPDLYVGSRPPSPCGYGMRRKRLSCIERSPLYQDCTKYSTRYSVSSVICERVIVTSLNVLSLLVNAADNKQRDRRMSFLKITIDP